MHKINTFRLDYHHKSYHYHNIILVLITVINTFHINVSIILYICVILITVITNLYITIIFIYIIMIIPIFIKKITPKIVGFSPYKHQTFLIIILDIKKTSTVTAQRILLIKLAHFLYNRPWRINTNMLRGFYVLVTLLTICSSFYSNDYKFI